MKTKNKNHTTGEKLFLKKCYYSELFYCLFFNAIQNTHLLNDSKNNFDGKNYQWKYFSQFSLSCDPESQLYLSSCLPVCTEK